MEYCIISDTMVLFDWNTDRASCSMELLLSTLKNPSQLNLCTIISGPVVLPISQMPLCHCTGIQHVTMVCSSHHRASTSKAQMFSSSWLSWKHGMSSERCSIFHVGPHLPLQLLRLGFHLTASTQLWQRGEHLERRIWKPTFTSEVVRLTYGSGSRQGEDVYIFGAAGRC